VFVEYNISGLYFIWQLPLVISLRFG
jgi:hypothetical protein